MVLLGVFVCCWLAGGLVDVCMSRLVPWWARPRSGCGWSSPSIPERGRSPRRGPAERPPEGTPDYPAAAVLTRP